VNRDVIFRRNLVHDVAVEYSGAPGVIYFYSVGARIEHNEIYNLPCAHSIPRCWHRSRLACHAQRPDVWATSIILMVALLTILLDSGISLGWGWDREVAYGRDNHVRGNLIHHILLKLWDGGFLYTIGMTV
jgi:hypothetical protein